MTILAFPWITSVPENAKYSEGYLKLILRMYEYNLHCYNYSSVIRTLSNFNNTHVISLLDKVQKECFLTLYVNKVRCSLHYFFIFCVYMYEKVTSVELFLVCCCYSTNYTRFFIRKKHNLTVKIWVQNNESKFISQRLFQSEF